MLLVCLIYLMQLRAYFSIAIIKTNFFRVVNHPYSLATIKYVASHIAKKICCLTLQMQDSGVLVNCCSLEGKIARLEVMGCKAMQSLNCILHPVSKYSLCKLI